MATDEVRDALIAAAPEHADLIRTRDQVVEAWCREHGKDKDALTVGEILEIRALPEWKAAW